jgi:F-box protein 21
MLILAQISDMLNAIAENISRETPTILESTPRQKALIIASYLLSNNYTGIQTGREYHSLEHSFLGLALRDPDHNSLPLISAAIFCYVAQRFGLNAQPCGFPFHVHAIILPAAGFDMDGNTWTNDDEGAPPMYMDPFRYKNEIPVANLQHQLNLFGAATAEYASYLGQSPISNIVMRCGRNIWNSLQNQQHAGTVPDTLDIDSVRYAGIWSLMLSTPQVWLLQIRRYLPWFMELFFKEFPWDISLVEQYILTMFQGSAEYENVAEGLRVTRTVDEMPKQVRRREAEHKNVRYHVGEVFRHRRYNYQAIITGWDSECGAGEEWMRRMNVDQLQAGRKQSFYHALLVNLSPC